MSSVGANKLASSIAISDRRLHAGMVDLDPKLLYECQVSKISAMICVHVSVCVCVCYLRVCVSVCV